MKKIDVLDNTIRVLTQDDANALAFREKLSIAKSLQAIGVNAIELPAVQCEKEDKIIYRTIAESVQTTVAIPVEGSEESIACAYACVQNAKSRRLQVELPVSTVQMEYSYHLKAPKMLQKISATVKAAAACGVEVEFIAKDATRAEEGFLEQCAVAAKESGASIITLCDDNGEYFPEEFAELVKKVKAACDIKVYVQPSNALKLAPAIFTECVKAGADGVKTATCKKALSVETVAAIMRAKSATLGAECTLDTTVVNKTVQDIKDVCKKGIEEEKTSLSATLSLDENATLKDIENEVISLGYELSTADLGKVYEEFKRVATKKGKIGERELEAIVAVTAMQVPSTYHLNAYVVNSGNVISSTASVTLEKDGETLSGVSMGDGPIDAAFHAIEQIIGHHYELDDFNVQAVTKGREAVGSAIIRLRAGGKLYAGNGVSTDTVDACIRAYINALNKIVYDEQ